MDTDSRWMRHCLELAGRGAGYVSPNPMVGSVLVDARGRCLGEGWHARYGGPHAEVNAVADAEKRYDADTIRQATMYVNLEPCNHYGKTPPCTRLILDKGIGRVVIGMQDPFPKVAGSGIERLRRHGVEVKVGVLEPECRRFNEAYIRHLATGRPLVILKMAQTLDGRIATLKGDARWISGEAARMRVHRWRSTLDAVLVGSGTARADNPALTVRHVEGRQPVRIVLDRTGTLPPHLKLFTDAFAGHTIAVVNETARPAYAETLTAANGRILRIPETGGHLDLKLMLTRLGAEGGPDGQRLLSVMVEAGSGLSTALIDQDLVDRLLLFIAPKVLGSGKPTVADLNIHRMMNVVSFSDHHWERIGPDLLFTGYRRTV